jgi:hypothetical protein
MKGSIRRRKGFDFDAKTRFVLETMAINFNNHEHIPSQLETSPILNDRRNRPETCSPPIEAWISVAKSRTVDRASETPVWAEFASLACIRSTRGLRHVWLAERHVFLSIRAGLPMTERVSLDNGPLNSVECIIYAPRIWILQILTQSLEVNGSQIERLFNSRRTEISD